MATVPCFLMLSLEQSLRLVDGGGGAKLGSRRYADVVTLYFVATLLATIQPQLGAGAGLFAK